MCISLQKQSLALMLSIIMMNLKKIFLRFMKEESAMRLSGKCSGCALA